MMNTIRFLFLMILFSLNLSSASAKVSNGSLAAGLASNPNATDNFYPSELTGNSEPTEGSAPCVCKMAVTDGLYTNTSAALNSSGAPKNKNSDGIE